jgi:ubiquinol-cytochrome c reductase cytochrome c subunit
MNASSGVIGVGLVVALLASIQASDGAPAAPAAVASPAAAAGPPGDPIAGKATFTQECSICHGSAAQGFVGPHIGGINWGTAGLHSIVRGGLGGYGGMPAFNGEVVTDTDIANIASFLATLPPPPAAAASASTSPAASGASSAPGAASAKTAAAGSGDPVHGKVIFAANCAACHGATGGGGVGPNLHGEKARKDDAAAIAWIKNPVLPMPKLYPSPLSEKDVDDVAAFVESL